MKKIISLFVVLVFVLNISVFAVVEVRKPASDVKFNAYIDYKDDIAIEEDELEAPIIEEGSDDLDYNTYGTANSNYTVTKKSPNKTIIFSAVCVLVIGAVIIISKVSQK